MLKCHYCTDTAHMELHPNIILCLHCFLKLLKAGQQLGGYAFYPVRLLPGAEILEQKAEKEVDTND